MRDETASSRSRLMKSGADAATCVAMIRWPMRQRFYDDVRALGDTLVAEGHEALGEEVKLAVEAGATSSEILMRLRKAFDDALQRDALSEPLRARVARQLKAVERALA